MEFVLKPYFIQTQFSLMDAVFWLAFRFPPIYKDSILDSDGDTLWNDGPNTFFSRDAIHGNYELLKNSKTPVYPRCEQDYTPSVRVYHTERYVKTVRGKIEKRRVMMMYPQDEAYGDGYSAESLDRYYKEKDEYNKLYKVAVERAKIRLFEMLLDEKIVAEGVSNKKIRMKYTKAPGCSDHLHDEFSNEFHINNVAVDIVVDSDFSKNTFWGYSGDFKRIDKSEWQIDRIDWEASRLNGVNGYDEITIPSESIFQEIPIEKKVKLESFVFEGVIYGVDFDSVIQLSQNNRGLGRPRMYDYEDFFVYLDSLIGSQSGHTQDSLAQSLVEFFYKKNSKEMPINSAKDIVRKYIKQNNNRPLM